MPRLYRNESSDATINAQRNLSGRTHYVDPETLRWHKSRILATRVIDGGLLFALIESCALDMNNTRRGFRFVAFDVFGKVVSRVNLDECWRTREQASKAMWRWLETVDAVGMTLAAITRAEHEHAREMSELRAELDKRAAA